MKLEDTLTVTVEDVEIIFEAPDFQEFLNITDLLGKGLKEQSAYVNSKILEVHNLFKSDGSAVTVEDFQNFKVRFSFQQKLIGAWIAGVYKELGVTVEVEQKKEPEAVGNSSDGSSDTAS